MIKLTYKQSQILKDLYGPMNTLEIAKKKGRTKASIRGYMVKIYKKMEVKDRIELMAKKIEELTKRKVR